jgi:hypothetical protein
MRSGTSSTPSSRSSTRPAPRWATLNYNIDTNPLDQALGLNNDGGVFSENPATHKFGGQVFHVAPGASIPFDMTNHMNYFKPGSDSLRNIADIATGDYSGVTN